MAFKPWSLGDRFCKFRRHSSYLLSEHMPRQQLTATTLILIGCNLGAAVLLCLQLFAREFRPFLFCCFEFDPCDKV